MKSSAIRNASFAMIACLGLLGLAPSATAAAAASGLTTSAAIVSGVITNAAGKADSKGEPAPSPAFDRLMQATDYAAPGSSATATPNIIYCPVTPEAIYYNIPEHFITTETFGGAIPETVIEGTNSSTTATLGIATFAGETWSLNGTGSITDSSTNSVSVAYSVSRTIYNRVNYRDYRYSCPYVHTKRQPYNFYDLLTRDGGQTSIKWEFYCASHDAGTTWSTQNATSATVGGGVNLPSINVSAQAGFGKSVELDFHFNKAGEICGNSEEGPLHASLLEADPY
jgi:hypothetical protein